jgi:hypothetical protein
MPPRCTTCHAPLEVRLDARGVDLACSCGEGLDRLGRIAETITSRILYSDEAPVDLDIAIEALHREVEDRFPDRLWLFEAIYEARWRRLRDQGWSYGGGGA